MLQGLSICALTDADRSAACHVFEAAIQDAFEKERLGALKDHISNEIAHKKTLLDASLGTLKQEIFFLSAKLGDTVIGTISCGRSGEIIRRFTDASVHDLNELGSLYILPDYQDMGVGSALIGALLTRLHENGSEYFCLDSGYRRAQQRWLKKFGPPYMTLEKFWGPDNDHLIWVCKTADYIT